MAVATKARTPSATSTITSGRIASLTASDLLAARRLQLVAELADQRGEVASRVDLRRQVDVADRVGDEVAMGVEERPGEHHDAQSRRLVADQLDGDGADAGDRDGRGGRPIRLPV